MFAHAKALRNRPRFRWEYVDTVYCEKAVSHELCCPANHVSTIYIYIHTHTHILHACTHTHTDTRLTALCPGLPGWAGTKKAKPIWILLKQETVSGSGISWAVCKSAPRSRQITTPAPHHSVFYRPDALPAAQPTASKHWRLHTYTVGVKQVRPMCELTGAMGNEPLMQQLIIPILLPFLALHDTAVKLLPSLIYTHTHIHCE